MLVRSSHLSFLALHHSQSSHVFTQCLFQGHASCMPGATRAIRAYPLIYPLFSDNTRFNTTLSSRHVFRGSFAFVSFGTYLTDLSPPFPAPFTTKMLSHSAAAGSLHPPSRWRVRWAFHHHQVHFVAQSLASLFILLGFKSQRGQRVRRGRKLKLQCTSLLEPGTKHSTPPETEICDYKAFR